VLSMLYLSKLLPPKNGMHLIKAQNNGQINYPR
jgi:hypothetical protein